MTAWRTIASDAGRFAPVMWRGLISYGDPGRTRRWQDRRLRALVQYAARHVPYYQQLFREHNIDPRSIRGVDDLPRIPITDKATLKRLPLRHRVSDQFQADRLIRHATSGSSGIPFQIRRTWFDERRMNVFWVRNMLRQGVHPRDRIVMLVGSRPVPSGDRLFVQWGLAQIGLFSQTKIHSLRPPEEVLEDTVRCRPDRLMGYAWALLRMGEVYAATGRRGFWPQAVHTFGEVVTPDMRRRLAESYQCPVYDIYGSYEFGMAAFECRTHASFHVADDAVVLEVLRHGAAVREGEAGTITGTNLLGYAMPFLRFAIGDIARGGPQPCSCGWRGSTITHVKGRMLDMFPLPDGRRIHPYEIVFLMIERLGDRIFQYQLIQENLNEVVLYLVPTPHRSTEGFAEFIANVERLLGPQVRFRIETVDAIDFERSGKFRVSRSRVLSAYDEPSSD
jgi:phenylacetate-CoA ligase